MATVPIEIVLQDAETPVDPTPTPESGEETNIIVPNTGTISNDGDSNGGIGSTISIILPIVIAVLALGAMVALLIRRQQKRKKANDSNDSTEKCNTKVNKKIISRKEKLATVTSGTIAILAATVLVGNLVIPATNAATNVEPGTADLETEDKITIVATREADNDSGTVTATVKDTSYATANLDFGYKVTASMAEGMTSANLYLDGDETGEYYIAPVEDGTLADNTWGYTLSEPTEESSYLSIPLSTKPTNIIKEIAKTAEDKPVDIYYTVQIDKDMPNGTYTGELEYTLSPAIEYMQDFSTLTPAEETATLARMTEGKQYILKDSRDNNPYYISRLADENVWMTQNLDLDIDENTTYTHADTDLGWSDPAHPDLTANWKPDEGHSTIRFTAGEGAAVEGWESSSTAPYSANPGNVYYYTSGNSDPDTFYDSQEACERVHSDGSCPHYHAGNYYNWSAAVASNDTSEMTEQYQNAPNSICPAGWRLPEGPNAESLTDGNELDAIFTRYDGIVGDLNSCGGTCIYRNFLPSGFNYIRTNPIWMVRSGYINEYGGTHSGRFYSGGGYSYDYSSTMHGYGLEVTAAYMRPSYSAPYYGGSVRCVVR